MISYANLVGDLKISPHTVKHSAAWLDGFEIGDHRVKLS